MIYKTAIGKLMSSITYKKMFKHYNYIQKINFDNLLDARGNYDKITLLPTHTHEFDIPVLDYTYEENFEKEHCKFIMRDDYRIRFKGVNFPVNLSLYLFTKHVNGAIPISQTGKEKTLSDRIEEINESFQEGFNLVIFPGATREFGYINGLSRGNVKNYCDLIKKNNLDKNHCCIPTSIIYEPEFKKILLNFGKAVSIENKDSSEISTKIIDSLAEQTKTDLNNIIKRNVVWKFIQNR